MSTRAIDYITADFYESISFQDGEMPDLDTFRSLFFDNGILINNTFAKPIKFTAETFSHTIESQIAEGSLKHYMQRELYFKTDIFGKIAQRISVYEYNFSDQEAEQLPKGISYIQFIQRDDQWQITSVAWNDENENYQIPVGWLHG